MDPKDVFFFSTSTFPATCLSTAPHKANRLTSYRKELIKAGKFIKASTGQAFEVTSEVIDHWIKTFQRMAVNGVKVPIPLSHAAVDNPEKNVGWVHSMFRENDTLVAIMGLLDPELALTTDVSIYVQGEVIDGNGEKYVEPITHVALCTNPVIPGLGEFVKLSLSKGDSDMELRKKIAALLGIASGESTDESVVLALQSKLAAPGTVLPAPSDPLAALPNLVNSPNVQVLKLAQENRAAKLASLVTAGLISPAISAAITARYVEANALTLELSKGANDSFDFLYEILSKNVPTAGLLDGKTNVQTLELANPGTAKKSVLAIAMDARREAAGMKV